MTEFVRLKQLGSEQRRLADELQSRAQRMEIEVYLRAQELQEANRRLREANEKLAAKERELTLLYERLRRLDRLKTQFFANVSHELRTPLTLILGPVEKLLSSEGPSEAQRRDLEVVARNARLLLRHVNDLLDVAKLEAGKMAPSYREVDLAKLVRQTASNFEALAGQRAFTFAVEAPQTVPAQIDPEKVQRVLMNVLSNAFKFTPAGGIVRCALSPPQGQSDAPLKGRAVITVSDSGPGVTPELREAIFERFFQAEESSTRRFGGTGLGLSIARDFVELHGGSIEKAIRLRPDLVLSDVMMPSMSGAEMIREIRAHPELDAVPVVVLTAKADDDLRVRLLREGAQDYLVKPFSAEELRARVDNLLTAKRAREELEARSETLRRLTSQLEAANKELEAFSYSVSHDLRAPLRAIDGFSRLLLEKHGEQLDPEAKRLLGVVRNNTQNMGQLIDDLLAFSRLGRQDVRETAIDMASLVQRVFEELRSANPGRNLSLRVGALPPARGDGALIKQVWVNLLSNAIKFTRDRERATIEVGARASARENVYFVKDNGVGFDMQYAPKLFGVFRRLHSAAEFEGTGVGLAIVQRVVHRHGGRVWAESKPGEGATFYFALPRKGGRGD